MLAGGRSTRMGRDKALLPAGSVTLVEQIAACVREAAGNVTLIGSPERYEFLGLPVERDVVEGMGPMGGLCTALRVTSGDWNLLVACDMPRLTAGFLRTLLDAAETAGKDCLVPMTAVGQLEPLCAVYHRRTLAAVEQAIHRKILKMQDFVRTLDFEAWPVPEASPLHNVNTPEQWEAR